MKHLFIYILCLALSMQVGFANNEMPLDGDPPSYTAPNGKTYTWKDNFSQLSVDYTLAELVNMPVWICCGNTSFQKLPSEACRKGILNSGIKPHQVNNISADKTYTNSLGQTFTPDPNRLRLYGFCMVESDSRGIKQEVDINKVCEELKQQMRKEGVEPCNDLTPQNIYPDYNQNLIYYTVCGKTMSKPMTDEFRRPVTTAPVVKEVVRNCEDDFVNLPVVKICEGETYTWDMNGTTYNEAGTYMYSTPKADNCGKTNTILNLDYHEPIDQTIVPEEKFDFAGGETYIFQDITLNAPGTYTEEYIDANGCNAIATIVLQEKETKQICSDCITNARDLGNIEFAIRGNHGQQPVSPSSHPINHTSTFGSIEVGYWKDWRNKRDLLNGITCKNTLFEYGIIGGIATNQLYSGESSECDCNDASKASNIHAYLEPAVRWHFLGLCDNNKFLPIPVVGAGLRMHYNDHKLDDISKISLSPKAFAEGRWYFSKLIRTPRAITVADNDREDINSLFFAVGGEAFAPAFTFDKLNYVGYLKLGLRF